MKKIISILLVLILLTMPMFSGLNKHGYTMFDGWVYVDYNNEGEWVQADLGSYVSNKQSLIRVSLQVLDIDTDGSEYVSFAIREYNGNYTSNYQGSTSYNLGKKVELQCYTDDDGIIEYKIDYGWWESKKVRVVLILENSIN